METPNNQDVANLLDSLRDLAQAAELTDHEIAEIALESNEQVDSLMHRIDSIAEATDTMVSDLEKIEAQVSEELDNLMIDELLEEDEVEPTA